MQAQDTQRVYKIGYNYDPTTDGTNIITLLSNDLSLMAQKYPNLDPSSWVNGFINDLFCKSEIYSLGEVPIPQFTNLDSDSDRLSKSLAIQWGASSPKFLLNLWTSNKTNPSATNQSDWIDEGYISLIRTTGYAYNTYTLLDLITNDVAARIAEGEKLGFSIRDGGFGMPSVNDKIVVKGKFTQELNWISPDAANVVVVQGGTVQQVTAYTNSYQFTVRTTSVNLLGQNNARVSGTIQNTGSTNSVTVTYSGLTTGNQVTIAPGQTAALPSGYKGVVSGVCTATAGTTVVAAETYNA